MSRESRFSLAGMTLVLLFGFSLGVAGLMRHPILIDEMYALRHMGVFSPPHDLGQVYASVTTYSPNQLPLHYWLGAYWGQVAGWTQASHRAMSLLISMFTIVFVYRFGAEAFDRRAGLVAALLLATSAFAVIYMALIRMYALLLMLAALNAWLFWRLAHGRRATRLDLSLYALTTAMLLYTHILSLVWLASWAIYFLVDLRRIRRWRWIVLGWALGGLLFTPILLSFVQGVLYSSGLTQVWMDSSSTLDLAPALLEVLFNGAPLLLALSAGLLLWAYRRRRDRAIVGLAFVLGLQVILMLAADTLIDLVWPSRMRYFLMLWVPACVILGYGLVAVPKWRAIAIVGVLLWLAAGLRFVQTSRVLAFADGVGASYGYPPLQLLVPQLDPLVRPQDYLLGQANREYVNNTIRMGRSIADYYLNALLGIDGDFVPASLTGEAWRQRLETSIGNHPELLLLNDSRDETGQFGAMLALIEARYVACGARSELDGAWLQRYALRSTLCGREYQPIRYENGIRIVDRIASYDADAGVVEALIGWEVADAAQLQAYNISVQIYADEWRKVVQAPDRHLYDDVLKWYAVELPTEGLPPGDYRVVVILYDRYHSSDRVRGQDIVTGQMGEVLPILHFTVE